MKANWNKAKEVAHDMLEMKNIFFNFRYVRISTLISIIIGITHICASFAFIWISKILVDRAVAGQGGLRQASADFAFSLPDGLDTRCGETGAGLSEGQCQRLAIARALLHDAPIIIFDEGLSALDAGTAETILKRLTSHFKGRKTLLFVTHHSLVSDYCSMELDFSRISRQ